MSAEDIVHTIETKDDFVRFVRALRQDLLEEPNSWENCDLSSYLAALADWVQSMDGYFKNRRSPVPNQPNWKFIGQMLMAASTYE